MKQIKNRSRSFRFAACCLAVSLGVGEAQAQQTKEGQLMDALTNSSKVEPDAVEKLLAAGANPNVLSSDPNSSGIPALILAARKDLIATRMLLDKGANVNIKSEARRYNGPYVDAGFTPLMAVVGVAREWPSTADQEWATKYQTPEALKTTRLLLERKADVNARSNHDVTALILAASNGLYVPQVGANSWRLDNNSSIKTNIVLSLLTAGADVNARSESGTTALYQAVRTQATDVAQIFIKAGADKNSKNTALREAVRLAYAAWSQNFPNPVPMVRLLLEAGADPNAFDGALIGDMISYVTQYKEARGEDEITAVLQVLLPNGFYVKGRQGSTLLKWAEKYNHSQLADLLKKHGAQP